MASAAPSSGSVPTPGSSSRTSGACAAAARISHRLATWAEKVDRLRSMFCSSPTSANTAGEARQPRALGGGNQQAALRHQRAEAERLQRHRLAAGVRSGDDQHPLVGRQQEVDRRHRAPGEEQTGMARLAQRDRPVAERRPRAAVGAGEVRPRDQAVDLDQRVDARRDRLVLGADQRGEVGEDALHDRLLLAHGEEQLVVQLDGEERLDEERLARDRAVLHDARAARPAPKRDRHDEAVVAQRDVGVGDDVGHALRGHQVLEPAGQRVAQAADRGAHARQRVARLVEHAAVVVERARRASSRAAGTRPGDRAGRASAGRARAWRRKKAPTLRLVSSAGAPRPAILPSSAKPSCAALRRCGRTSAKARSGGSPCCSSRRKHCQARSSAASATARSGAGASARQASRPGSTRRARPGAHTRAGTRARAGRGGAWVASIAKREWGLATQGRDQ